MRNLASTETTYLTKLRRAFLDHGLSVSLCTVSTNFGAGDDQQEAPLRQAREAMRIATFLGAPLLRVFAGTAPAAADKDAALERAAQAVRRVCREAAEVGLPIGLQNHNHGALCGTGQDVLRFFRLVDHPNLTFILGASWFGPDAIFKDKKGVDSSTWFYVWTVFNI